jgi:hypothetical protein
MIYFVPGTDIEKPEVKLAGEDGNAFSIMGRVSNALKRAGVPKNVIDTYHRESTSGDYDNLLRVAMEYSREPDEDIFDDEEYADEEEED